MAKARTKRAISEAPKADLAVRIVVETDSATPTYYVNHAEVTMGVHELSLLFARLPTKPSRDEIEEARKSGEIVVEPEFQILIPPSLLPGLIEALQTTRANYEPVFGAIRKGES